MFFASFPLTITICAPRSHSPGLASLPDGLDGFLRCTLRRILNVSRDRLQISGMRSDHPQPAQCSGPVARQKLLGLAFDVLFLRDAEQFLNLVLTNQPIPKLFEMILSLSVLLPEVPL